MEDYVKSLDELNDIRKGKEEPLTKEEMKVYRKITGKVAWIAENTRPDLSFTAFALSERNQEATIADLKKLNHVIQKIKSRPAKIMYKKVGKMYKRKSEKEKK